MIGPRSLSLDLVIYISEIPNTGFEIITLIATESKTSTRMAM